MIIHTAGRGETFEEIAGIYGVSPDELAYMNGLRVDFPLPSGTAVLVRVPSQVYTAAEGDTLIGIAREYSTTVNAVLRANPWITLKTPLFEGEKLNISYDGDEDRFTRAYTYAYPFIDEMLFDSILPYLSGISPFTYGFRPDGSLIEIPDEWMIDDAGEYGVSPVMHLSTLTEDGGFDSSLAALALTNADIQAALIQNALSKMREKGYASIDVDFEYIPSELGGAYYTFISALSRAISPYGYELMTALAPKTSAEQPGLLYEAQNYTLLGRASDQVLIMTYEWGYSAGPPMAVSPINKVREVLDYAVSAIPPEKILLGMSIYGYDWKLPYVKGTNPARSLSPEEAVELAAEKGADIQYSVYAESPFFYYYEDGVTHEVWFEDARSISARLKLIDEYGLKGAGFWHAGRGAVQCWQTLDAMFDIRAELY